MITRLYIDNFKCMVNFELKPGPVQLFYGENGSGKSSVFEVIARLRDFLTWGKPVQEMFPRSTLTAWQSKKVQSLEVDLLAEVGTSRYRLAVEHHPDNEQCRVQEEVLQFEGKHLYMFDGESSHLFRDDGSTGVVFAHDSSRSFIASIPERDENRLLTGFKTQIGSMYIYAIDPFRMAEFSPADEWAPDPSLGNFASWYRHLTQESLEAMGPLFASLREVIDGFEWLKPVSQGPTGRLLCVGFEQDGSEGRPSRFTLSLGQLSEGQRCLIALYTLLHCGIRPHSTICIDEPDNFIALRELQPWIIEFCDRVEERNAQCLIISHHPEFIDLLAVKHGVRFTRAAQGPVQIRDVEWSESDGISLSEKVARGWED